MSDHLPEPSEGKRPILTKESPVQATTNIPNMMPPIPIILKWLLILFILFGLHKTLSASTNRIVSLSPVTTEIIAALGCKNEIVGVTTLCNYPESITSRPKVGDITLNYEAIFTLKPTHIISLGRNDAIKTKLSPLNDHLYSFQSPKSIQDTLQLITNIGQVLNKEKEAKQLISRLTQQLKEIRPIKPTNQNVLVVIWYPPVMTISNDTFIADMLHHAGYKVVTVPGKIEFPRLEKEVILTLNPDIILVMHQDMLEPIKNEKVYQYTTAGKNNAIITIENPDLIVRAGPRILEGIQMLKRLRSELR